MRRSHRNLALIAFAATLAAALCLWRVLVLEGRIGNTTTTEAEEMQTTTTEWISGGDTKTVSTDRETIDGEPEALEDWAARHAEAVKFWKSECPPDAK